MDTSTDSQPLPVDVFNVSFSFCWENHLRRNKCLIKASPVTLRKLMYFQGGTSVCYDITNKNTCRFVEIRRLNTSDYLNCHNIYRFTSSCHWCENCSVLQAFLQRFVKNAIARCTVHAFTVSVPQRYHTDHLHSTITLWYHHRIKICKTEKSHSSI